MIAATSLLFGIPLLIALNALSNYLHNRDIKKALMKAGIKEEDITITGTMVTYKYPVTEEDD